MILALIIALGVVNPDVTQDNIARTICVSGWTATVRPPLAYTQALKRNQLRGQADRNLSHYEEDHHVPLEVGGHPTDEGNLRPQKWSQARIKDRLEHAVRQMVCSGQMTLEQGQQIFLDLRVEP